MKNIPSDWKAPSDCKAFSAKKLSELDARQRDAAIAFLRTYFSAEMMQLIREAEKDNPQTWWVSYHRFWGMSVRNALRANGFGEEDLSVKTLDDYYVGLMEAAAAE